jgi:hypothetical protein
LQKNDDAARTISSKVKEMSKMAEVKVRSPTLIESIGLGGVACVFTVNFTHPIETVKTRMQVTGNGLGQVFSSTLKNEGVGSFWKGIVWAWGREGSYASIKLGAYAPVRDAIGAGEKDCKLFLFLVVVCLGKWF